MLLILTFLIRVAVADDTHPDIFLTWTLTLLYSPYLTSTGNPQVR